MKFRLRPIFRLKPIGVRGVKLLLILTISTLIICILALFLKEEENYTIRRSHSFHNSEYVTRQFMTAGSKMITLWTEYNHDKFKYLANVEENLSKCPHKCAVTSNPKYVLDSDAVFFHLTDIWVPNWEIGTKGTVPCPNESHPNQVWIIHNNEPPFSFFGDVDIFGHVFNWTMWYRSDATIYDPYGRYLSVDVVGKEGSLKRFERKNFYSEKSKFMVGAISNCKDPGRRYLLIHEIAKYLDIDMFGKCYGNRMCGTTWRDGNTDCDEELNKYRFYLAFESNHCKDYITEKYWSALDRHQIPVVNWKRMDILSGYVPNSYINVYDFPSVKEFADYIKMVNSNATLYNSFFEWRKKFTIDLTWRRAWCDLCRTLHLMDKHYEPQAVDFREYLNADICPHTMKETHDAELIASADFQAMREAEGTFL